MKLSNTYPSSPNSTDQDRPLHPEGQAWREGEDMGILAGNHGEEENEYQSRKPLHLPWGGRDKGQSEAEECQEWEDAPPPYTWYK